MELLIQRGADVNLTNKAGIAGSFEFELRESSHAPLFRRSFLGFWNLSFERARVHDSDMYDSSSVLMRYVSFAALHRAAMWNQVEAIRVLSRSGASHRLPSKPSALFPNGETPLDSALRYSRQEAAAALQRVGQDHASMSLARTAHDACHIG
jgi:hypothetical protein